MPLDSGNPTPKLGKTSATDAQPKLRTLGDYEIRREIGRGGMGTVYEAWERSLQRVVAIKILGQHVSATHSAVIRFQREAQAAAKLHHTHIVPIFAQGEEDGVYYYAMELIEGRSLNEIITEQRKLHTADTDTINLDDTIILNRTSTSEVDDDSSQTATVAAVPHPVTSQTSTITMVDAQFVEIAKHVSDVADALAYAHDEGIIHRDIKPHNLILGNDGRMRVSDFGLARILEQPGVTVTGEMLGSPLYMSPEQIREGPAKTDYRTDIYSLGATLYEWLAFQPPYPGETREQVISLILTSEPRPLRNLNALVPTDLETICTKAIERDPAKRYQSAAEFRDDLRRFVQRSPIKAKRASLAARGVKFIGRHQVASLMGIAALIAIVMGSTLLRNQGELANQQAAVVEAQQQTQEALRQAATLGEILSQLVPVPGADAAVPILQNLLEAAQQRSTTSSNDASVRKPVVATPTGIAWRAATTFYEAIAAANPLRRQPGGGDELSELLYIARELWATDASVALQHVDSYLAIRKNDFEARMLRTALEARVGYFDKMLVDCDELVRRWGRASLPHLWRGLALFLAGRPEESLEELDIATDLRGPTVWTKSFRGLVLAHLGRLDEARLQFNGSLEHDPNSVVALTGRAEILKRLNQISEAIVDAGRAIQLDSTNTDALTIRGDCHVILNHYAAGVDDFQLAITIIGRTPALSMRVASAQFQKQRATIPQPVDAEVPGQAQPSDEMGEPTGKSSSLIEIVNWLTQRMEKKNPAPSSQYAVASQPRSLSGTVRCIFPR